MLEKWLCHECEKGFLLIEEDTKGREVGCPYCLTTGDHVEATAGQNPDEDYRDEMGCLWPGYNEFDKIFYKLSKDEISVEESIKQINARLHGEKPTMRRLSHPKWMAFSFGVKKMIKAIKSGRSPLQDDKNHKCYRCVWANYAGYKVLCSRKPCVREKNRAFVQKP